MTAETSQGFVCVVDRTPKESITRAPVYDRRSDTAHARVSLSICITSHWPKQPQKINLAQCEVECNSIHGFTPDASMRLCSPTIVLSNLVNPFPPMIFCISSVPHPVFFTLPRSYPFPCRCLQPPHAHTCTNPQWWNSLVFCSIKVMPSLAAVSNTAPSF